jgi:hypothetical protein
LRTLAIGATAPYRAARYFQHYLHAEQSTRLSASEKRVHIKSWQALTQYKHFIETGTYLGQTTLAMSEVFETCHTIEFDPDLFNRAKANLAGVKNIQAYCGDSAKILPTILSELKEPAVFWLDAHYSGGETGRAGLDTPIMRELGTIFAHPIKEHVILVDDARDFLGINDYPTIKTLLKAISEQSPYIVTIFGDIIRIYPANY